MFRPDRVGDHPLIAIDQLPYAYGTIGSFTHADTEFEPMLTDATIRAQSASTNFNAVTPTVANNNSMSFGVAINGANPAGDITDSVVANGFLATVSGSIGFRRVSGTTEEPQVMAAIGRAAQATLILEATGNNPCTNFQNFPLNQLQSTGDFVVASFNRTLVLGNFNGAVTYSDDPIIVGFTISSRGGDAVWAVNGGLNIYKYTSDLLTFDPTRT